MVRPEAFYADNRIETRFGTTVRRRGRGREDARGRRRRSRVLRQAPDRDGRAQPTLPDPGDRPRRGPRPPDARRCGRGSARRCCPGRRVVMAGMGFIGSEVAASLRQRGLEVHVVAGGKAPLDRVLGEDVGRVIEGIHRDHGVEMTFDDQVAGFEGDGRVRTVTTASGLQPVVRLRRARSRCGAGRRVPRRIGDRGG